MTDTTSGGIELPIVTDGMEYIAGRELRMKDTVHIADPRSSAVSVLKVGSKVPDWAVDLIPADLVEENAAGALPLSMTGGMRPPGDDGGDTGGQHRDE